MKENKVFIIETQEGQARKEAVKRVLKNKPPTVEQSDWQRRKQLNKSNKAIRQRGFRVKGTETGGTFTHNAIQIGRNEPCHCGSGIKFKKCHMEMQRIQKTA